MDASERHRMLEQYRDGARVVAEAVASLSRTDLDRHTGEEWTARSVVHHIADSELMEGVRLRRMLAEEEPVLPWVDEGEHARRLHYERPVELSLALYQAVVAANAALAELLSEAEWQRAGRHSVVGRYTVEDWLRKMSEHARDHAAQMLRAAGRDVI